MKQKDVSSRSILGSFLSLMSVLCYLGTLVCIYLCFVSGWLYLLAALGCFLLALLLSVLANKAKFDQLKKSYVSQGIDQKIREDSGDMHYTIGLYNQMPNKFMLDYIQSLNPAAWKKIHDEILAQIQR